MRANRRRGGALAGILLVVLILGVLAVAALVSTGLFIAHNVRVTEKTAHGETTIETPFGTMRVRESPRFDAKRLGLPVYPGAVREEDSRKLASLHFDFGERHKEFAVMAAAYRTSDSVDRVTEFYRHELPHWLFSQKRHGGFQLEMTEGGRKKIVVIHEDGDETRIGLASVGEPASN
jgi:hypothetical protein